MYKVKEIFTTIQGEGYNAGRVAVFVRFAGCNLWDGTNAGRDKGKAGCAKWCDTDFLGGDEYTREDLVKKIHQAWPNAYGKRFVVFTGGEPTLQLDAELLQAVKDDGYTSAIETNGLKKLPVGLDWVTVSPKTPKLNVKSGNELKLVHPQGFNPYNFQDLDFEHFYLSPLDNSRHSTDKCIAFCLYNPQWRLSSQQHKNWGIR